MDWTAARAIATFNRMHIRMATWPADKWIYNCSRSLYGGDWRVFIMGGTERERNGTQGVRCTDFGRAEFEATNWTTMPAALAACQVTSTEPLGGGDPTPGAGGFGGTVISGGSGGGGGGDTGDPPHLPPPDPGTSLRVRFADIHQNTNTTDNPGTELTVVGVNISPRTYSLTPNGPGAWRTTFHSGHLHNPAIGADPADSDQFAWEVTASIADSLDGKPTFHVTLHAFDDGHAGSLPSGGFAESAPAIRGTPMNNTIEPDVSVAFASGTATVL